jgi:hypothetical protein
MSTLTAPKPKHDIVPRDETRRIPARLGRYVESATDATREVISQPGAQKSTLVIDRRAVTHSDPRLVAHLAADEPPENARIIVAAYLADPTRGRCRTLTAQDLQSAPFTDPLAENDSDTAWDEPLHDHHGIAYRIRTVSTNGSFPALRWTRRLAQGEQEPIELLALRDVVVRLQEYAQARAITIAALVAHRHDRCVSTHRLRGELDRLNTSSIVLNRGLRKLVEQRLARGDLSMSEIAIRCGRIKQDKRGNIAGETSWLARRIGQLPEGGETEPSPWVQTDVLALIVRDGLGASPHEAEL